MTIVASVNVYDGIVLGTDSVTQLWGADTSGGMGFVKAYPHAEKLFHVGELPIGVMTYGIGNLGARSIASLVTELSAQFSAPTIDRSVKGVATKFAEFLSEEHSKAFKDSPRPDLGIVVAGYSPNTPLADQWEFNIPKMRTPAQVRPMEQFGASWRGITIPFARLYTGIDPRVPQELTKLGIKPDQIQALQQQFVAPLRFDGMPVQEAIDFVAFILETTINMAKFEVGVATCGEPLSVAAITRSEGFTWLRRHKWAV